MIFPLSEKNTLKSGDKVKLNLKHIRSNPGYKKLSKAYIAFVNTHKDTIFTIENPRGTFINWRTVWSFKEDTTEPKWLFQEADLIRIKENKKG